MYDRTLVPLDSSKSAELAGAFNSELVLLYVCEPAESQYRHTHQLYIEKMVELMNSHVKGNLSTGMSRQKQIFLAIQSHIV